MAIAPTLDRLRDVMRLSAQKDFDWARVSETTSIDALGFDSLAILDLLYDIQQEFNVRF